MFIINLLALIFMWALSEIVRLGSFFVDPETLVVVRFTAKVPPYNQGETAGFPPRMAQRYKSLGLAEDVPQDEIDMMREHPGFSAKQLIEQQRIAAQAVQPAMASGTAGPPMAMRSATAPAPAPAATAPQAQAQAKAEAKAADKPADKKE